MKKKLALATMILLFTASFIGCKKQDEETKPLRSKILGRWQVNKIEVTTTLENGPNTVTTNYGASDYIDFKDNSSDDVEVSLGINNRFLGAFSTGINNTLFLSFSQRKLDCTVTTITDRQFQFTGTVTGSNPKITETYYLSR
jgi:hypothetical protein